MKMGYYTLKDPPKSDGDYVTVRDLETLKAELVDLFREATQKIPGSEEAIE
jgi:hypothetical protein